MWALENNTPFAAERTWVRDENGAETWLVAVKGSFILSDDGTFVLKEEQDPVSRVPVFRGDPAATSLVCESDLIHKKLATDVLVDGYAYASYGRATERVDVRLRVATIDKTLRVFGERFVEGGFVGVSASAPKPFTKMPIIYERSFGGTDTADENPKRHGWEARNPVGRGYGTRTQHVIGKPAPNVEYPGATYSSTEKGRPAGFGPIARHWQPRQALAGTYDEAWEEDRMPLLPLDFDERFYQCAPEDQQVQGYLRGGERVSIENMTPEGTMVFDVPRVTLSFSTLIANERMDHRAVLHTVLIQPDTRQVTLTWHTSLMCHGRDHKLLETSIREKVQTSLSGEPIGNGRWRA